METVFFADKVRTAEQSEGGKVVGVDSTVITARQYLSPMVVQDGGLMSFPADARKLAEKIKKKGGGKLVGVETNLVDQVWGKERPSQPNEQVKVLDAQFSGKKFQEKLDDLRKELEKKKSAGLIVCVSCWNIKLTRSIHTCITNSSSSYA